MSQRINLIIVPDEGGRARRLSLSLFWLRFSAITISVLLLVVIAGAISYGFLAKTAVQYEIVKAENERLKMENKRIIEVAKEVNESRRILAQIIKSLGGHLDIGTPESLDSLNLDAALLRESSSLLGNVQGNNFSFAAQREVMHNLPTVLPVKGFLTQKFFEDPLFPKRSHRGIDIAARTGSSVVAAASGTVVFEGWTPRYGNCMVIAHKGDYITVYGHNQINFKSIRDQVERGEPIALLGTSGYSSAPHLHFEIWKNGVPIDPAEMLGDLEKTTASN